MEVFATRHWNVPTQDSIWIKPMSSIPVCPSIDTDENSSTDSTRSSICSLDSSPLTPSPIMNKNDIWKEYDLPIDQPKVIRRDLLRIRHQYLTQLGIRLSVQKLEQTMATRKVPIEGIKVRLKEPSEYEEQDHLSYNSRGLLEKISFWYGGKNDIVKQSLKKSLSKSHTSDQHLNAKSFTNSSLSIELKSNSEIENYNEEKKNEKRRRVCFHEEAEMFLIPLHQEYTERQREGMWHTRQEFVDMVERNLEDAYLEMEKEYIRQLEIEEKKLQASKQVQLVELEAAKKSRVDLYRAKSPQQIRKKYLTQLGFQKKGMINQQKTILSN